MNVPNRSGLKVLGGNDPDCCEPGCCSTDAPSKGSVDVGSKQRRVDVELQVPGRGEKYRRCPDGARPAA